MSQGHFHFDLDHPYLKKHLIAYIGSKRALQGFLCDVLSRTAVKAWEEGTGGKVFLDPFAGSGTVSRLARLIGFRVLAINAIRSTIERNYPGFDLDDREEKEKAMLLASLLYQCATHTNTSSVFKACHKGFGSHGRDALKRIMSPIRLDIPELIDSAPEKSVEVFCEEAAVFARRHSGDLCYLDPPYNQHQYGSDYHLLNTIACWDKPAVSNELRTKGRLIRLKKVSLLLKRSFCPQRIAETFRLDADDLLVEAEGGAYRLPMKHRCLFCPPAAGILSGIEASDLERFFNRLTG